MKIFLIYLSLGFISNFIGPLAKHLSIENKFSLKENKSKSWFYKYSFVVLMRVIMTTIYPLFYFSYFILKRKPEEPISFEDT